VTAVDLKIEHATVVTLDGGRRVLEDGAVAIRGDRIAAVDTTAALAGQPAGRTIDATGRLVLPGLVSAHCHNLESLLRGLGIDVGADLWTFDGAYTYEALLTEEDAYWATLLGCAEMIRSGTTCHADPGGYVMDGVGRALTDCGLRGIFGWAGQDEAAPGYEPPPGFPGLRSAEETLTAGERLVKRWHQTANDRVRVSYGLRLEPNVSDELFQGVRAYAERDATLVQFHCLLPGLSEAVKERVGMSTVQWMAGLGVLGPNWLLAHVSDASDSDVVIVKMHDAKVAYTPGAGSKGKLPELLSRGVTVGLGCDPTATPRGLFRAMSRLATAHGADSGSPDRLPPEKALEMATIDGARALGWDGDIGSLEAGKRADVIVLASPEAGPAPGSPLAASLISAGDGADVDTTIVDGRVLMENGRLTTVDVEKVLAAGQRIAERIASKLPRRETLRPRWPALESSAERREKA